MRKKQKQYGNMNLYHPKVIYAFLIYCRLYVQQYLMGHFRRQQQEARRLLLFDLLLLI